MTKKKNKKNVIRNINKSLFRRKVKRNRAFRIAKRDQYDSTYTITKKESFIPKNEIILKADRNFELLKNPQTVIDYIANLKSFAKDNQNVDSIFIDLSDVLNIDIGSICILLSSIVELNIYGINLRGNTPVDVKANKVFIESGYLKHMSNLSSKLQQKIKTFTGDNLILMSGSEKSESRKIGECIKNAVQILSGVASHYPPIYGMILEMNCNSVEHAYHKNKHWLLGVNIDKENKKIIFTYADNGFGVLGTLRRKFAEVLEDTFKLKENSEILEGLFDRKYNSRFKKQYNRNKGLPVIKRAFVNGKVKDLLVITNDVSLHFGKDESLKLNNAFSGTFYYWELDLETIENERNRV